MKKNTIIVINPSNGNIMKAICNALITNLINIVIFGQKQIIKNLCDKLNVSVSLFRIIECNTEKEIIFKLEKYQEQINIDGIIIDDIKDMKVKEQLKYISLCHIVDYGVFKKSLFIVNDNPKKNINEIINDLFSLFEKLNIKEKNIGIVSYNKEKAICKRKLIKEHFKLETVDIIDFDRIRKGYYNIIIFDNKQLKQTYINQVNELILPRIIEINKASNSLVFDAKGKKFKNIFFGFLFFSKIECLNNEFYSQTV